LKSFIDYLDGKIIIKLAPVNGEEHNDVYEDEDAEDEDENYSHDERQSWIDRISFQVIGDEKRRGYERCQDYEIENNDDCVH
jgi:hypothetical protein